MSKSESPHIDSKVYSYNVLDNACSVEVSTHAAILEFDEIGDHAVYNPCPFVRDGKLMLLGRVEPLQSEISHVDLFEKKEGNGAWTPTGFRLDHVQDPFLSCIHGRLVVGGVELVLKKMFSGLFTISNYQTSFWDFETKEKIAEGPKGMKDIRLIELDTNLGVFTRPRSEKKGKVTSSINFDYAATLQDVTAEHITSISTDPLKELKGFFDTNEWGGVNNVYRLADGWLGVIGHIAYYGKEVDEAGRKIRKYAAMSFEFKPETGEMEHPVVMLARRHLPFNIQPKRSDLHEVIFPGGVIFLSEKNSKTGELDVPLSSEILFFYGVGDAYVGVSKLAYPFSRKLLKENANESLFVLPKDKVGEYILFNIEQ